MRIPLRPVVVACLVVLSVVGTLYAQGAGGSISGAAKDETGAVLPGVTVVVTNTETGRARTLVTGADGRYAAPNLAPGPYEIQASLEGFSTVQRSGVTLIIGREAVVDLTLKLGSVSDKIEVIGEAPTVDLKGGSTGGVVTTDQIEGLPLNGRSYVELSTLTPGVLIDQTGNQSTSNGFGVKLSVNGSRYTANLFTLDGTNMNDEYSQAGSASGNLLGVEAVREFQVLTNSFSAEYGHHTGGIVNAATKSGTNAIHGSAFEFHRDASLDTKNYFDQEKPPFTRNQFGASIGGPIMKNRTFFFGNFEALHETLGQTTTWTVPSDALRASTTVVPAIKPWLLAFPVGNGGPVDANRANYITVTSRKTDENYAMGRVDHQFSPSSQVFGRYTFNDASVDDPAAQLNTGAITRTRLQYLTVEHTGIKGTAFLNRLQFGMTRSVLDGYDYMLPGMTMPQTTFNDVNDGSIAVLSVTGLSALGGNTLNPKYHRFANYQIRDNITYTRGIQTLKVGGDIQILHYSVTSDFTTPGQFTFSSIPNFIAGRVNVFNVQMPGSDANRQLRQTAFGFYVQDDIQVRKNFTLNVGVRYEPTTSITDAKDELAQLIDFASPTATLNDTTHVKALFQNPSLKTIAPRVGFAWDVTGDGKTAIRGGAGMFYDVVLASTPFVQNTALRVPPFFTRGSLLGSTTVVDFPNAYYTQASRLGTSGAQLEGIQYNLDQPYVQKWNLNIQRQLAGKTTLEIGYSGNRGVHLVRQIFTNGRVGVPVPGGTWYIAPGTPLAQPNFGRMRNRVSNGVSSYTGVSVGLTRRVSAGLQAQASYTFSHAIDTGASALGGTDFTNESAGGRYLGAADSGLSPFDQRHSFVGNISYELPFAKNATGATAAFAKGWNVAMLVRVRTGYPFSGLSGVDTGLQTAGWAPDYPDLIPGKSNNPTLGTISQWFDPTSFSLPAPGYIGNLGRNTIVGPGRQTVDLTFSRDIRFGGTREVQLRLECFNLLNHVNLGTPNSTIFNGDGTRNANAGRITTADPARQVQLGAKIVW